MPRERSRSRSRSPDYKRRKPSDRSRREPSPTRSSSRRDDRDRDWDRDRDRSRRDDRHRDDDRDRDRYRERDRERNRDRDRDRDRRRYDDDRRRRDDSPPSSRRKGDSSPPRSTAPASRQLSVDSPAQSPGPQTEEEKQRAKRERLEKWKRDREAQKANGGSGSPAPARHDSRSGATGRAGLPPKPTFSLSTSTLSRAGLPVRPGVVPNRTTAALDDEAAPSRRLETLTLPPVDPEANPDGVEAVAEPEPEVVKRAFKFEAEDDDDAMEGVEATSSRPRRPVKREVKVEMDEDEDEDPLDAYMNANSKEVRAVNEKDSHRTGSRIAAVDKDEVDDEEVLDAKQKELQTKEAILAQAAAKTRKKDLPPPDHSKIDYEPFRKAFYHPPQEIEDMTEEDSELMRLEMGSIKIRGKDAPKPVRNWGAFGLPAPVLDVIKRNGYEAPTAIQAQTVPAIMSGRDVIGVAKTGSGKTLAFLLPLFRHIKAQRPLSANEGPIALIMTPTRELALQIHKEAKPFLKALGMKGTTVYGGAPISEQIAAMKTGAELVVCTPGRMIDLLTANSGRVVNMRRVTYLVLDEADRMFDMGFEPQVMKIIGLIRPDRQTVLFSATFPKLMESLASRILINKLEITVGGRSVVAPEIDQRVEIRTQESKFNRLLEILGEMAQLHDDPDFRTLIFVDRQESADDLFHNLLQRGYISTSLHGGKEQVDRDEAIKNFQKGDVPIVVATSVAARGLDVKELKLVINYDCPNHLEDYVHRAGRTGRAGNKGVCITFITPEQEKYSIDIVVAMTQSNAFISDELKAMSDGFKAKIKQGRAKAVSSGFRGKGLDKLAAKRDEKDRGERATYGDTTEATSLASREGALVAYQPVVKKAQGGPADMRGEHDYTFSDVKVEIVHGPAPDKLPSALAGSGIGDVRIPPHTLAALARARAEGNKAEADKLQIIVNKLQQSIQASKAERFGAAMLDARKTKDPDATDYHAIFPINDFPQKARWKATNKEQMVQLIEMSQASITNKGIYYAPGTEPSPGEEPKLHLLIESNDEAKVRIAVDELRRILTEASFEALQTADRGGAGGPTGRYTV